MTPHYRILPTADRDLDEQAEYLARESGLDRAEHFYAAAAATFEKLARMPGLGERRQSPNPRVAGLRVSRVDGFEKSLIFYQPTADGVDIVRVLHGARDIDRLLDSEEEET